MRINAGVFFKCCGLDHALVNCVEESDVEINSVLINLIKLIQRCCIEHS